jgi:hypothetical protein
MNLAAGLLCDSHQEYMGKLCVLGVFDQLVVTSLPVIVPSFGLIFRLVGEHGDDGEHEACIQLTNPDGAPVGPALKTSFSLSPGSVGFCTYNLRFHVQELRLVDVGLHKWNLSVDGKHLGVIWMGVAHMPK